MKPEVELSKFAKRLLAKAIPEPNTGCLLWEGAVANGYAVIRKPSGGNTRAHRAIYETLVAPIPANTLVRHRCDTALCVNPDHLLIGTHADNMADRAKKNARAPVRHNLTSDQAAAIVELARRGVAYTVIANHFGIRPGWISRIINAWNVPGKQGAA